MRSIHMDNKKRGLPRPLSIPSTFGITAFLFATLLFLTQVWATEKAFVMEEITVVGQKIDDFIKKNPNQVETMDKSRMAGIGK